MTTEAELIQKSQLQKEGRDSCFSVLLVAYFMLASARINFLCSAIAQQRSKNYPSKRPLWFSVVSC